MNLYYILMTRVTFFEKVEEAFGVELVSDRVDIAYDVR